MNAHLQRLIYDSYSAGCSIGGGVVTQKNLKFGTGFSCYFGFPGLQPH